MFQSVKYFRSCHLFYYVFLLDPNTILYVVFIGVPSMSSINGSSSTNLIRYPGFLYIPLPNNEIVVSFVFYLRFYS